MDWCELPFPRSPNAPAPPLVRSRLASPRLGRLAREPAQQPASTAEQEQCELCGAQMMKRWGRNGWFLGCSTYPKCKFTSANKPIAEKCPACGSEFLVEKFLKAGPVIACPNKECDFERPNENPPPAATSGEVSPTT